ncbi:unnamed protein product [Allacma fusca]|uniref:Cuticle protein n=1 Tax=Allacma fusca TaxID=39272 RepID=A0A8J2PYK3_9HEXA|nr:unnamed protein product [Allacma fusca]
MMKIAAFFAVLAVTNALPQALIFAGAPGRQAEPADAYPQYSFSYNVNDPTTGDQKSQQESRDGDNVSGSYSLVEPDGSVRTVTYTADAVNGFNAVVEKTPLAPAPQPAPAPVVVVRRPAPVQRIVAAAPRPQQQLVVLPQNLNQGIYNPYYSYSSLLGNLGGGQILNGGHILNGGQILNGGHIINGGQILGGNRIILA